MGSKFPAVQRNYDANIHKVTASDVPLRRGKYGHTSQPAAQPAAQAAPPTASPIEEQRRRRNAGGANVLG